MPEAQAGVASILANDVVEEDRLRAGLYRLIAGLLTAPPSSDMLRAAAALTGDETPLGLAIARLARAADAATAEVEGEAYHNLFVGLGRGILVPFGSYYLTGFLHEKPLAKLRQTMAAHGIAREEGVGEPEDHVASLLEMMAGLIDGSFGSALDPKGQKLFYGEHIGSWMPYFFRDLAGNEESELYAALGAMGSAFLEIEERAFRMV